MADLGISEGIMIALAVAAAAASTGTALYTSDQTNKATQAAATRQANNTAENQQRANEAAATYRQQQEDLRNRQYQQVESERGRQAKLQSEADAQLRLSQNSASISEQLKKQKQQEAALGADYGQVADTADAQTPGVSTGAEAADEAGTRVVAGGYKDELKKVSAFLGGQAKGQAGLDAMTNAGLLDSIEQGRNMGNLNRISNFMKGSANVLPTETGAANTARSLIDQTQAANVALFQGAQNRINDKAAVDINAAQHSGDTGMAISSLLGMTGTLAAGYAGNSLGTSNSADDAAFSTALANFGTAKPKVIYDSAGNPVKTAPTTTKIF
jgi:flagellar biosynthesis GTPase FlhF